MIDNNINKLISMAERQSDQRLAQELNPQTETGLLGPAFISASELAYRQKIRDEAQAQPMQSPPIVQQLASQAAMSPMQQMPTAPMPMQQPMQQPMPMPQQPLPSFQTGGLVDDITYGNPFMRMAQTGMPTDVMGNYPFSFDGGGRFVSDSFELDPVFNQPIDDTPVFLQNVGQGIQNVGQSIADFSNRVQARVDARREAEAERKRKESIVVDQDRLLQGLNPRQANNIPIPKIDMSVKTNSIVTTPNAKTLKQAAQNSQGAGTLTQTTGTTTATGTQLTPAQQNALLTQAQSNSSPVVTTATGTSINTPPSTGVSKAAKKDAAYAASSDYETLIQQSINAMTDEKGKMQNKWLRIAAGAFNAAQKGSPTLLGGLADLGAGVTEELLALNKEEQDQAQELFALYAAREELAYKRYTTQNDYDKDRQTRLADSIKNYNADLARYLNTDITKDMTKREAEAKTATQYADQGVKPAQSNYARFVKEINGIITNIDEQIAEGSLNINDREDAIDQALKSDKALSYVYDVGRDRETKGREDWLEVPLLK